VPSQKQPSGAGPSSATLWPAGGWVKRYLIAVLSSATAGGVEAGASTEEAMATVGEATATVENKAVSTMRNFIFDCRES